MSEPRDTTDESDQDQHQHPPAHPSSDSDDFLDEETEDDDFSPLAAPAPAPAPAPTPAPAAASPPAAAFTPTPAAPDLISDGVPREVPLSTEVLGVPDQDENVGETKLGVEGVENGAMDGVLPAEAAVKQEEGVGLGLELDETRPKSPNFLLLEGEDSGTEDDQIAFMKELERFHRERGLEYKPPKFYGEWLNCLKLWKKVARLGGYEQVTTCKLWRSVGESFRPPKTCTTVSWTFRIFYEKALLEYEKHKIRTGELQVPISSLSETMAADKKMGGNQPSGSGRARRDAAARAMEGWHSQRLLSNGDLGDPLIKGKNSGSLFKRDKYSKSSGGSHKRKTSSLDRAVQVPRARYVNTHGDSMVMDVGEPADWVKINVRQTKDCYEVYALVPGLLREEVHVQSDACGRLVISGNPEQPDNPWGVTPFKKVITLPSQIDPHQTSAVVTLHGQLFVRAPFEQSD